MKRLVGALCFLAAAFGMSSAFAGEWAFVDNTLSATFPNGATVDYVFKADSSYSASTGETGAWTYDGTTFCFTPDGAEALCGPFDGSKVVGDTWTADAWDGSGAITYKLS